MEQGFGWALPVVMRLPVPHELGQAFLLFSKSDAYFISFQPFQTASGVEEKKDHAEHFFPGTPTFLEKLYGLNSL